MVKIKCHQYNAAIKIAANVNTFLWSALCKRETAHIIRFVSFRKSLYSTTNAIGGHKRGET